MTRIPPRIEVEPPESAARLRRIENALFSQRPRWQDHPEPSEPWHRRAFGRQLKLAGAFAAAMCVTAFATWQFAQPTRGELGPTAEMILTDDAPRQLELDQGVVGVQAETKLIVGDDRQGSVELDLRRGAVDLELSMKDWRSQLSVAAGDIQVSAVHDHGVRPAFTVKRAGGVKVVVERGTVVVTAGDVQTYVSAGQQWNSSHVELSSSESDDPGPT